VIDENGQHVGGTGGAASRPASQAGASEDAPAGSGQIELPLGTPITDLELDHLKKMARQPNPRSDANDANRNPDDSGQSDDPQE
jgi:hypothetical protein